MQGGRLSMTCFCEQEVLNMKQNTQGFWFCVFTPYGNAFSSQHPSKAGIWCIPIQRLQCDNNSCQCWGTSRRENLATFPVLSHSSYGCLTQSEHGRCTGYACSFLHYIPRQSCLFSLVCQKTYLWFSIPKATTPIKPLIVSFLWFPLVSDLPHTDIICFPSTEDAGCDPFLSQVPFSSEVLC